LRAVRALELLALLMLISFSFFPLLPLYGWQAYGPSGEYMYISKAYRLRYNDPNFGNDKPHIFAHISGRPVDLIELSDQESEVNGTRLWGGGLAYSTRLIDGVLYAFYSGPVTFTKLVRPLSNGVEIAFVSNETLHLRLTLWRWYYSSIEGFSRPVSRNLTPSSSLFYTFTDGLGAFSGEIAMKPVPIGMGISGVPGQGLNKITLEFISKNVTLFIAAPEAPLSAPLLDIRGSNYLYPLIALLGALLYLRLTRRRA